MTIEEQLRIENLELRKIARCVVNYDYSVNLRLNHLFKS